MQNATDVKGAQNASQTCSTRIGYGGLNRRALYIGLGVGAAAGIFLGWDWLVAVGAASLIIAVAPCLVMCAFGLCMSRACRDKKTEVPAKADMANADAPLTRTATKDAPATNSAPANVTAATAVPDAGGDRVAAAKLADAKAPLEQPANQSATEARA